MAGPTSVSALLHAATMVAAGAYLVARLHPMLSQAGWFATATIAVGLVTALAGGVVARSEEHTSELQSLMRTSYAVFCLKTTNFNFLIYQASHQTHTATSVCRAH